LFSLGDYDDDFFEALGVMIAHDKGRLPQPGR
jgi:hypothetical protein